jgi:hypothetical protein
MKSFKLYLVALVAIFANNAFAGGIGGITTGFPGHVFPTQVVNWQVGDQSDYTLDIDGMKGSLHKEVTKNETPTQVWLEETVSIPNLGQNQTEDALIDRNTGKLLKLLVNGQEQQLPNEDVTVISHDQETITVPAGTFQVVHLVAKDGSNNQIEIYANPQLIVIDGAAKEIQGTQYGPLTLELVGQQKAGSDYKRFVQY